MAPECHLVVTDSGLGGLSVCAEVERLLRERPIARPVGITYVNAWPDEGAGYNDLSGRTARVEVFDRALARMDAMRPDRIAIACNTLSILYEHTEHARARGESRTAARALDSFSDWNHESVSRWKGETGTSGTDARTHDSLSEWRGETGGGRADSTADARSHDSLSPWTGERARVRGLTPVVGIIDTGVELFREALARDPSRSIVLLGTKTTIGSGVHQQRLIEAGVEPARIAAVPCHGLAGAIETDPAGERVSALIESCGASAARAAGPIRHRLYLGLCCTHYTYVREPLQAAVARHSARPVEALDPNARMAEGLWTHLAAHGRPEAYLAAHGRPDASRTVAINVISKVSLDAKRLVLAPLLERSAPLTAAALLDYTHDPDLF